jgi:hypothetical protein
MSGKQRPPGILETGLMEQTVKYIDNLPREGRAGNAGRVPVGESGAETRGDPLGY